MPSSGLPFDPNLVLGPLLWGTWLASGFAFMVYCAAIRYVQTNRDGWWTRGLVAAFVALSAIALGCSYADSYISLITYWGDVPAFASDQRPLVAQVILGSKVAWLLTNNATQIYERVDIRRSAISLNLPIRRLIATTIESGLSCAMIAIVPLVFYLRDPDSNFAVGFAFINTQVAAGTVIYTLYVTALQYNHR
ncbi:hypothetical protein RQP46_007490 [Phenoliferia psychrophenolica]